MVDAEQVDESLSPSRASTGAPSTAVPQGPIEPDRSDLPDSLSEHYAKVRDGKAGTIEDKAQRAVVLAEADAEAAKIRAKAA